MKKFRDLAFLAAIAGLAAYQGRQLHIYAATAQTPATTQNAGPTHGGDTAAPQNAGLAAAGGSLFQQNCAFCHGRDAGGGETGPDLTRSKLVSADVGGDKIGDVVLHGRPDKGMPAFQFTPEQITQLAAFIHAQQTKAMSQSGKRKGVDVADLQTGNVEAGKAYFNGAGGCAKCHSPTGDLAGIASRYEGLQLEERMLYPKDVKNKVTVTLPSGETVSGTLAYLDEFTVGLRDAAGTYRSWPVSEVKVKVDAPVEAHVALFPKYTDADIHNLMAYIQTLR
jgi:cytochrome c oxidase cbb3-type subunit 3